MTFLHLGNPVLKFIFKPCYCKKFIRKLRYSKCGIGVIFIVIVPCLIFVALCSSMGIAGFHFSIPSVRLFSQKKANLSDAETSPNIRIAVDRQCRNGPGNVMQILHPANDSENVMKVEDFYVHGHRKFIISSPKNKDARVAIRQTWGHFGMRSDSAIAFVVGRVMNEEIEDSLTQEDAIYMDLIRGNFVDTYDNLTLKIISMLEWVDNACPNASFVLKSDDDMFLNVQKLLNFITNHSHAKRKIYGSIVKGGRPIRRFLSKYYASETQYPSEYLPTFATGPAYLLTSDIVHDLYTTALKQPFLKFEDVFITGIVADLLKISRRSIPMLANTWVSYHPCNIQRRISIHSVKSFEQHELWRLLFLKTKGC